jgi:hypothetical protein
MSFENAGVKKLLLQIALHRYWKANFIGNKLERNW